MFYFIYGEQKDEARKKAHSLLGLLQGKRPNAETFRFSVDDFQVDRLPEFLSGQGLFDKKYIIFFDSLFSNEVFEELICDRLDELKTSENAFVILEGKTTKDVLKKIEKRAEKVFEFSDEKKVKKEGFKVFDLADAFGRRDKKSLWMLLVKAYEEDSAPEEIHGILFWQLKSMLLAGTTASASEASLNPYVYTKAKGFLKNYSVDELKTISSTLLSMYHKAHRGEIDFKTNLEVWVLGL